MARRVLVEQRVVEDEPGLADARGPVDEGDLAETRRALVARDVGADQVSALVGVDLDRAAALERDAEAPDQVPWSCERVGRATVPSTRRASGVVKTSSVGMFATKSMPSRRGREPRLPDRRRGGARRSDPCRGRGSGARRTCARSARSARCAEAGEVLLPRGDRVGLVEPDGGRDRVPEPVDVGLAEHARRPALARVRDDRPVAAARRSASGPVSASSRIRVRPSARAVEAGEEPGSGLPMIASSAPPSSPRSSSRCTSHGGDQPSMSSGALLRCAAAERAGRE